MVVQGGDRLAGGFGLEAILKGLCAGLDFFLDPLFDACGDQLFSFCLACLYLLVNVSVPPLFEITFEVVGVLVDQLLVCGGHKVVFHGFEAL